MLLVGVIYRKEEMLEIIQDCVEYVCKHCFYCNNSWECMVTKKLQQEADDDQEDVYRYGIKCKLKTMPFFPKTKRL